MIKIKFTKHTGISELEPIYNYEADLLEVSSTKGKLKEWKYGVDINGSIIFDLDESFKLLNFDLLIPKSKWVVRESLAKFSNKEVFIKKQDLQFERESIDKKSYSLPLYVETDSNYDEVLISFSERGEFVNNKFFQLSSNCYIFLVENNLAGFFLRTL